MKKTLTINLWGQVFHIDEDAYEVLQDYLSRIENRFSGSLEGKEIMGDVESRIAELFRERLGLTREVVNLDDVNELIGIIGSPEDFEESSESEEQTNSGKKSKSGSKRLFRNPDDRVLGGVGGGLAAYFGIDPTVARLLLILTFFMSGPLIYIVLWIIVPEAQTTTQKLEMSGDPINLSNIEKKIKDEFGKVRDTLKSDKTKRKFKDATSTSKDVFVGFFHVFFRAFVVILGISFLLLGSVMLIGLVLGFFIPSSNGLITTQFLELFFEKEMLILTILGIIFLIGVPVISLIISGIRMIFGIKYSFRILRKTLIGFFICGIILTGFVAFSQIFNYRFKSQSNEIIQVDSIKGKTLVLMSEYKNNPATEMEDLFDSDKWFIQFSDNNSLIVLKPMISINKSEKILPEINVSKTCWHKSKKDGQIFLKKLPSLVQVEDTVITISPYFNIPNGDTFRFQEEKISINLPVGSKIFIPKNVNFNFDMVDFEMDVLDEDIYGKTWIMKEKGLFLFTE